MKKTKEITGLPIISIFDGTEIGMVKNIIINAEDRSISYIVVENGLHLLGAKVISTERVLGIGEHAVTVEDENVVSMISKIPAAMDLLEKNVQIRGSKVLTKKGKLVGEITEIFVDEEDRCRIKGMEFLPLRGDGSAKFLPDKCIVTYGRHLIIILDAFESALSDLADFSQYAAVYSEPSRPFESFKAQTPAAPRQTETEPFRVSAYTARDAEPAAQSAEEAYIPQAGGIAVTYETTEKKSPDDIIGSEDETQEPFIIDSGSPDITEINSGAFIPEADTPVYPDAAQSGTEAAEPGTAGVDTEAGIETVPAIGAEAPPDAAQTFAEITGDIVEPVTYTGADIAGDIIEPAIYAGDTDVPDAATPADTAAGPAILPPEADIPATEEFSATAESISPTDMSQPPFELSPIIFEEEAAGSAQTAPQAMGDVSGMDAVLSEAVISDTAENAPIEAFGAESAAIPAADAAEEPENGAASGDSVLDAETSLFEQRQRSYLSGRIVTKTILDNRGNVLVEEGARITEDVIDRVRDSGRMVQLVMNNRS